jgi:hypothetical protein
MIVGQNYTAVRNDAAAYATAHQGVVVSVEALDGFSCLSLDSGQTLATDGDGIIFVARVNTGVLP